MSILLKTDRDLLFGRTVGAEQLPAGFRWTENKSVDIYSGIKNMFIGFYFQNILYLTQRSSNAVILTATTAGPAADVPSDYRSRNVKHTPALTLVSVSVHMRSVQGCGI